jgi:hypothetical protein
MRKLTTLLMAGALGMGFGARAMAEDTTPGYPTSPAGEMERGRSAVEGAAKDTEGAVKDTGRAATDTGRAMEGKTATDLSGHERESVSLSDLPAAAQDALKKEAKGGKIEEVTKETGKDGKVMYGAEIVKDGKGRDVEVSAEGKVLSKGKAHNESMEGTKSEKSESTKY